ncbi:putative Ig domain-containing protein [Nostoc sp.]|uniref:putative Ig domain-containing protein n=1 Tax=Nostoc sp. TaxID=1180 RepID=UPI002FFAC0B0
MPSNDPNDGSLIERNSEGQVVNTFRLGSYERLFNEDLNQDGFKGSVRIIDSDIDKDDYTILYELIEPLGDDPKKYKVSYAVRDPQIRVTTQVGYSNQVPFGPILQERIPNFLLKSNENGSPAPVGYYNLPSGQLNFGENNPGNGWKAIAASFVPTELKTITEQLGTFPYSVVKRDVVSEGFVYVMWKSPDANNPRWYLWRFKMGASNNYYEPSSNSGTFYQPPNIDAVEDYMGADHTRGLNTTAEVAEYESQFSEDFNEDGFIGITDIVEEAGDVTLALVNYKEKDRFSGSQIETGQTKVTYQLKDKNETRAKKVFNENEVGNNSDWKPIAVERVFVNISELPLAHYYAMGQNSDSTYSLLILNEYGSKIAKKVVLLANLSAYEIDFKQDLNRDGIINQVSEAIDVVGTASLLSSSNGYIIDEQEEKQYLKLNDGTLLKEATLNQLGIVLLQIEKTVTGYQLLQNTNNGTTLELVTVDATGTIQSTQSINYSEIPSYLNFKPPILSDITKSGFTDSIIFFTDEDFNNAFKDPDGNSLTKIQISSLPSNGILEFDGVAVTEDQEINVDNLSKLKFKPSSQFKSNVAFSWNGFDGTAYAASPAQVNLMIDSLNNAPTLDQPIADQSIPADTAFSFTFDANTFSDIDAGDSLTYSATLKDDSNLPSWLKFNPTTRTFSGTPTNTNVGSFTIEVQATDNDGVSATDTFVLAVEQSNSLPTFKLSKIADDIFNIFNSSGKSKLQVTLTGRSSNLVNELGAFTVDDAQGNINGIAPGAAGYTQAALDRAKVIFSAIANLPNGFNTNNLTHLLEFNSSDNLRFYLVRNSSTDAVRAGVTPLTDILFSDSLRQKITDLGSDQFSLAWKDTDGNSTTDFKDLVVKIQSTNDALPLSTNLQGKPQGEVIDLRDVTSQVKADFVVNREAAFDNFIGLYQVADENGGIDTNLDGKADIFTGQAGYIEAAVRGRVADIDLTVNNQGTATYTGTFQPGSILAPFIIVNGKPDALLDSNSNNNPSVYFPFLGANADKLDHLRLLGSNIFGFEDLANGGDKDFNDAIVQVNLSIV